MHRQGDQNIKYNRIVIERLNAIIPKIVDAFDPDEIIMYGSYARGDNDIYSDIDLIIVADTILRFQDRSLRALSVLEEEEDGNQIAINPIVYTHAELRQMLEKKESFLMSALQESVVIWKKEANTNLEVLLENGEIKSDFVKYM